MSRTNEYYEIKHGYSTLVERNGTHNYKTPEEAVARAKAFKENPKMDNPTMSDENAEYWKKETYTIEQHIHTVNVLEII